MLRGVEGFDEALYRLFKALKSELEAYFGIEYVSRLQTNRYQMKEKVSVFLGKASLAKKSRLWVKFPGLELVSPWPRAIKKRRQLP